MTELERLAAEYRDACRLVRALWLKLIRQPVVSDARRVVTTQYNDARHRVFETRKTLLKLAAEAIDDTWEVGG